jgi:hypothetical protein
MPDSTPLWVNEPMVLLSTDLSIHNTSYNATWNSITRASILIVIFGALGYQTFGLSWPILLTVLGIIYYSNFLVKPQTGNSWQPVKEGFKDKMPVKKVKQTQEEVGFESIIPEVEQYPYETKPSAKNPFMNVLLDELKYNPDRPAAAPVGSPMVKNTLSDFFKVQWTSDPTDVFGRTQSQRQFYTTPNTSIPNDQGSYANWLYLVPGKTCKEGGKDQCVPGTNGGPIPWLTKPN